MCPEGRGKNTLHLSWTKSTFVQYQFHCLYSFSAVLPCKNVLTLDDVMLQVQRIYVNSGLTGGGRGVAGKGLKGCQTFQDL